MTNECLERSTRSSIAETTLVGGFCAAVGIVVLTGWAFDVAALKSIVPGWVTIKVNTAIAFVLSGFALVLLGRPPTTLASPWFARTRTHGPEVLGALVALIGLLTLGEYAFGWNPGIDQWVFREAEVAVATATPGRMAPDTALCFLLLGTGLGLTGRARKARVDPLYRASDSEANVATRDFLENLVSHANAPIVVWDPQFRITRFNQAFEKLSGRSAGDVMGTSLDLLFPKQSAASSMKLIKEATGGERWEGVEVNILSTDGSIRTVLWNFATVFAADGKTPAATLAQGLDITERKRGEEETRSLNAQLEAANKELEAFSYSVSHDLRAPLRAIDGYGRMLSEDFKDRLNEDGQRILGVISSETRRMGQLVDDLLAFSRIGRQRLEFTDVDMTKLARAVADQEVSRQPKRVIEVQVEPLPMAQGDRATLRVVLVNLLSNAVKFTAPRNPALIEIGGLRVGDELVYHVKDNGVGFDMKYVAKLFGVFQRLHSDEEFEGTGVGLALVQRVINRHGGRVWGEGESGSGATFYFSLPCRKEENP